MAESLDAMKVALSVTSLVEYLALRKVERLAECSADWMEARLAGRKG